MSQLRRVLLLVAAAVLLTGCGSVVPDDFPADPDGTLDRVRSGGVLRVGASPRPGWVDVAGESRLGGLADRVRAIAAHHHRRLDHLVEAASGLGPAPVPVFAEILFPPQHLGLMAESETYAHLEHLRLSGEVESRRVDGLLRYKPVS